MKSFKFLPTILSIVFAVACFHVSVNGQSADDKNKFAAISGSGSSVRWDVAAQYSELTLTISAPDGQVFRKEFKAGSVPEFTLLDKEGNRLPDGKYTYELRLTPVISSEVKKELKAARSKSKGDDDAAPEREMRKRGLLPSQSLVQSGGFMILRGSVIVPGGVEPGVQRRSAKMNLRQRGLMPERPYVQTESFSIQEATFIPTRSAETPYKAFAHAAFPDQVIPDDLIVQGSLCVGFDCVNNEAFGFDTIRLKENNLRILFDDTSTSAGYPANDWQLTANDSASGGVSKFSIEDITGAKVPFTVEAGATTNSIYVDSTGRVGLRTSTPVLDIHTNTSNTPAIRLEQNNSGGFTAQTWDIGSNEANFFIRDVTGGSLLPFRIRPGAPTSTLDISAAGNVGIGTTNPVFSANAAKFLAVSAGSGSFSEIGAGGSQTATDGNLGTIAFFNSNLTGTEKRNAVILGSNDGATNSGNIRFFTASGGTIGERMRIGSNGRVGIGTVAPADKLEVSGGNIRVTGGNFIDDGVTLNAPDYVFEADYRLMSLDELRAYIARNKHLPNIPSAAEIRQNGLNLSQFQMKLLEKIEELTLHILSEQELRKAQQKEIEQLKEQVRQLQSRTGVK